MSDEREHTRRNNNSACLFHFRGRNIDNDTPPVVFETLIPPRRFGTVGTTTIIFSKAVTVARTHARTRARYGRRSRRQVRARASAVGETRTATTTAAAGRDGTTSHMLRACAFSRRLASVRAEPRAPPQHRVNTRTRDFTCGVTVSRAARGGNRTRDDKHPPRPWSRARQWDLARGDGGGSRAGRPPRCSCLGGKRTPFAVSGPRTRRGTNRASGKHVRGGPRRPFFVTVAACRTGSHVDGPTCRTRSG